MRLNPNRYYSLIEMENLDEGDYEIVDERMNVSTKNSRVIRYPTFKLKKVEDG